MTGAIEFLRKAKAICIAHKKCNEACPLYYTVCGNICSIEPVDVVTMVMAYKIKEVADEQEQEYDVETGDAGQI